MFASPPASLFSATAFDFLPKKIGLDSSVNENEQTSQLLDFIVAVAKLLYFIKFSAHFFYMENDAEIFLAHYTWKVAEKGFKMASMMNKLSINNSCEIILEI